MWSGGKGKPIDIWSHKKQETIAHIYEKIQYWIQIKTGKQNKKNVVAIFLLLFMLICIKMDEINA